jgi:hypothetical protein
MTTLPVIVGDTMLSNGSMAVLAGNNYVHVEHLPNGQGGTFPITYYGFDQLQVVIVEPNGAAVGLNQSSGNLNFASSGDSPNQAVPGGNGQNQGNETQGGGTIAALQNGDMAVVTWGDYDHNYDLQILNSSLGVVKAPFVLASDLTNSSAGNPLAVVASNASEFVVAWATDDLQGLFYERFSLTGTAIGGPIEVKSPTAINNNTGNTNVNWGGSVSIDSQGNVIFGFSADDVYHTGYYEMFNSSNQVVANTSSQLIPTTGTGGTNLTVQNEEIAPQFVPVAGGGFLTAGYVPNGARNSTTGTYSSFGLYVQHVAADGTITNVSTTANVDPGGFQEPTFGYFGELSNGDLAFQEFGHTKADIFNPSTNTLVRDALNVPAGTYAGTGTGASYLSVPTAIATVTGAGLAALSVNSSNEVTAVACYAAGTLIRTDRGEIAVEALAIGDRVITVSDEARPIRWVGRRSYGGRFIMGRKDILPICFKAGSLDDNVPRRDLWVSPHHAMYCEGVLIEAKDLVNGVSVVQAESVERVEYFHIELETHDVIIAEGALSESFVDDDSRGMFHNAHEYRVLYPDTPNEPARYYARRLENGYEVEAARRRIELRAGIRNVGDDRPVPLRGYVDVVSPRCITGWAQNADHPEAPVCVDIYAGGVLIGRTLANQYRQDLEFGGRCSGRHSFVFTPPLGLRFTPGAIEVRRSLDGTALEFSAETGRRIAASDNRPERQRAATVTPHRKVKVRHRIA